MHYATLTLYGVIKRFSAFEICKGEKLADEKSANPIFNPLCVLYIACPRASS